MRTVTQAFPSLMETSPEPGKEKPPIHPPNRDPLPAPIEDPPVPGKKRNKDAPPIGDPPDPSDHPIKTFNEEGTAFTKYW